jgi:hypothetical protein
LDRDDRQRDLIQVKQRASAILPIVRRRKAATGMVVHLRDRARVNQTPPGDAPAPAVSAVNAPLEMVATAHRILDRIDAGVPEDDARLLFESIAQLRDSAILLSRRLDQADATALLTALDDLNARLRGG